MKELSFTYGRMSFCSKTFEMSPSLPEQVESRIKLFYMAPYGLTEGSFIDFEDATEKRGEKGFVWLHVAGTLSDEFWKHLSDFMDLTDEQVKLIRGAHKRSFFEEFHNGVFWSLQRPSVSEVVDAIENVNFFMGDRILITRQFSHDTAFMMTVHKLMAEGEALADLTIDCLCAELIQDVIGTFVEVLKIGGTRLEAIQSRIIKHPGKEELHLINSAQQIIWIFLNTVWPVETVLLALSRSRNKMITEQGRNELRYRFDEVASVVRMFETYRSMSYSLMDVYVSGLGLRTNETTMILTVIATLFLPPTLIAGIYGMNFQIPEVHLQWGYYFCLGSMIVVSGGLLYWLKTRGFIDFN